jgi:hypothetical protein
MTAARSHFDIELAYGQMVEGAVRELIASSTDHSTTFEVKSDRKAHDTGNIFVELQDGARTSGVMVSTAHWVIYDLAGLHGLDAKPKVLLWFELQSLIERLRALHAEGLPIIPAPASDGHSVRGLRVPILDALGIRRR